MTTDFWSTSENEKIEASTEFETGGGDIEPIPAKTQVLAAPDEAGWYYPDNGDPEYISLRWGILKPQEYGNRKVFQKLRVNDVDSKKADKAKRMLAAIDANAGGKLMAKGEAPSDEDLMRALVNKPMMLLLQVWEMEINGEERKGNWVSAVSPKGAGASAPKPAAAATKPTGRPAPAAAPADDDFDDDIPF